MLYFKKTYFFDEVEKTKIETGFRNRSLKRTQLLDFLFETSNIGSDKYFFGNINKKDLKFTRIKTSLESMLPKIIISYPLESGVNYYKYRLSFLSTVILCFLLFSVIVNFMGLIRNNIEISDFMIILGLFSTYVLLILLELKLTRSRVSVL